jgi:hypothetical protein
MSPNASLSCACGKAVVNVRLGVGTCSACGKLWVLEATWTPPKVTPPKRAAA